MYFFATGFVLLLALTTLRQAESCPQAFKFCFPSEKEESRCEVMPPEPYEGLACRMATDSDFYYDTLTGTCVNAPWSECMPRGRGAGFKTIEECEKACVKKESLQFDERWKFKSVNPMCNSPSNGGLCYAYIPSYFFNMETGKCSQFIYGGCGGNANRFSTLEECESICVKPGTVETMLLKVASAADDTKKTVGSLNPICKLARVTGRCKASFKRFYYDVDQGRCTEFIYGGCDSNMNNFKTLEECQKMCG